MPSYVLTYITALGIFLTLDAIWLSLAGRAIYVPEIGHLLRDSPNYFVAMAFYALFVAGLTFFVIEPGRGTGNFFHTTLYGGFFGLVSYATYDLTNLSTLRGFTVRLAMTDMAWGTILAAVVSGLTVYLLSAKTL
jgi:uncharacterized membrane protein